MKPARPHSQLGLHRTIWGGLTAVGILMTAFAAAPTAQAEAPERLPWGTTTDQGVITPRDSDRRYDTERSYRPRQAPADPYDTYDYDDGSDLYGNYGSGTDDSRYSNAAGSQGGYGGTRSPYTYGREGTDRGYKDERYGNNGPGDVYDDVYRPPANGSNANGYGSQSTPGYNGGYGSNDTYRPRRHDDHGANGNSYGQSPYENDINRDYASTQRGYTDPYRPSDPYDNGAPDQETFSIDEITGAGHRFFGSISKGLAQVIEYAFQRAGRPNGYILGEEAGGAFVAGLRYGEGKLYTKHLGTRRVYWQGPSIGYDFGAEGSKTLVLVYNLRHPSEIYKRFAGIDGSAYLVGGVGITFQAKDGVTLAPIRSGVGLRLGANLGYLHYTRRPTWNPF